MNSNNQKDIDDIAKKKYKYGFVTKIDSERPQKGINEKIKKFISKKKK